jgi:hypothetical protein
MNDAAMADHDAGSGDATKLDSTAAMVRAESGYLDATLAALVSRLSAVPGLKVTVSYRHGRLRRLIGDLPYINDLHRRGDPVREIVVAVGPYSYWLVVDPEQSLACGRDSTSLERGRVKEQMPFSRWASELFDEIARQNIANHDSMVALRSLVEQDRV